MHTHAHNHPSPSPPHPHTPSPWQVLRDPGRRARYNTQLSHAQCRGLVPLQEELDLTDLEQQQDAGEPQPHT